MTVGKLVLLAVAAMLLPVAAEAQQRRPTVPGQVTVENRRAATMTDLVLSSEDGITLARLAKPLAPGKKTVLKIGKTKGCVVGVAARFEDEGELDGPTDVCKDRVIRAVD